ncbi:DUF3078 domain-containing protein [Riemerella anatipestifer]|uniref:DUF3078 domain-containing protein n=1 Tax=Riemerella anatipestifer TaxID=34085 RepID=UPI0013734E5C|nr:DUF3078 domain-containing protein [Riemerella anatipestifer]MBT0550359.1 DUF3078 domain-containing protein [Riemerella anatipestifer]MBT0557008.1 DUF3078 domain-containing protein [Riemerella anatipestifer]MBT0561119.1 DUF3078 domain-containing protein [Riemerella anatipestifer]MCO4304890.1 DUF3078 domain-containing protein [Riemerella anatipestifer]MCO7352477.1 DUF3078 domain-containing protein [Riemerella anatipestifer]
MKKTFLMALAVVGAVASAQETVSDSTKHWSIVGQNTLMLNQAAFSNWVGGGANNVGWLAGTNYNMTYENGKNLWENIVVLGYGQNNTKGTGSRKTQDVINLSSNYGRKISQNWYASGGASLQTQFAPGYENGNDPSAKKTSSFMAPGYVMAGVGFTYKPNKNFVATLRPANARWTLVLDKDLQKAGNFGLKHDGDSSLFQFGFLGTAIYKIQLMENMSLINTASVFSDYLNHPERLVLGYNGVLNMKINKYVSSVITLDLLYDHNQIRKTQMRQTLGVGFAYNINKGVKKSDTKDNQSWK